MINDKQFTLDRNSFKELIEKKLKKINPFAYDAIVCLIDNDNDKSAFMVWLSFTGLYNIDLTEDEDKIVQKWYYWFGK